MVKVRHISRWLLISVIISCAACFAARLRLLLAQPYLSGADAYYYALQIRSLVENGALRMRDSSPLLPLMASIARLGLSYESTIVLWNAVLPFISALLVWAAFLLVRKMGSWSPGASKPSESSYSSESSGPSETSGASEASGGSFPWPVVTALCLIISPCFFFTAIEFPKYALAMVFVPLWGLALANHRLWPVSLAAVFLSCLGHRTMAVGAAVVLTPWIIRIILAGLGRLKKHKPLVAFELLAGCAAILTLFAFLIASRHSITLADLARLDWQGMRPALVTFLMRREIPPALKWEVIILFAFSLAFALFRLFDRHDQPNRMLQWPVLAYYLPWWLLFLFPFGSEEVMGLAERLILTAPAAFLGSLWIGCQPFRFQFRFRGSGLLRSLNLFPAASLVPATSPIPVASGVSATSWEPAKYRRMAASWIPNIFRVPAVSRIRCLTPMVLAVLVPALPALFAANYMQAIHPDRLNPDYALFHRVTEAITTRADRLDIPMLIAHRGMNFVYKYRTLKDSFPYEPEDHWPKDRTWRVVYSVSPSEWGYFLPENLLWDSGLVLPLPGPYTLVREDVWYEFREAVRATFDEDLHDRVFRSWLNPSEKRPAFLYPVPGRNGLGDHPKEPGTESQDPFRALP